MHDGDAALFGRVVAGQWPCAREPDLRPFVASAQELDVAEFAAGGGRQRRRGVLPYRQGLVQCGRAFFVVAAGGMHQRAAQGQAGAGAQHRVAGVVRFDDGAPQALQAGVECTGADGRLARFELGERSDAAGRRPRSGQGRDGARRGLQRGAGFDAERAPEQFAARRGLAGRSDAVARRGQAAHEQGLEVLVQRIAAHQARSQVGGFAGRAVRQARQRGFAQHRLGRGLEMAPLGRQPDLEGRAAGEAHAFEQFASQARNRQRLRRVALGQGLDIDIAFGVGRQRRHVAAQARVAEQAPQLAQVPAQRGQRVLGVFEEQVREVLARRAGVASEQVGEQRPDLEAARRGHRLAVAFHTRRAEEVDREAHGPMVARVPVACKRGLRPRRWSGR